MPDATPLFEVRHLTKRYGDNTVVDDLSFHIAPGECLGVIGPNGAGKTTTIRMCLGLTPPDAGEIRALGLRMPQDAMAIKAQLGVVAQFDTLDPDFTCAENLLVYGRYFGMKTAEIRERIPRLLEFGALSHKAQARPGELSGGMRRRLSLARALINFMDEAERLCSRLLVMDHGRKIAEGAPRALIAQHLEPDVVEAYGNGALALLESPVRQMAQRVEVSGETVFFYTQDARALLAALSAHPGLRTLHRPANLEDLFLKLTGRQIREEG